MTMLILLVVVLGLGYRCTTAEDRERWLENARTTFTHAKKIAAQKRQESQPFRDALRVRTPRVVVIPALIVLNLTVFTLMLRGPGGLSDPETLLGWGANFGPRTTNGEWWRLVTSMFVHAGLFQLAVNLLALAQVGLMLERLAGRATVAAVYLAAGVFASLLSLSSYPVAVHYGASGGVFGLYGLLGATVVWNLFHRRAFHRRPELDDHEPAVTTPFGATNSFGATTSFGATNSFDATGAFNVTTPLGSTSVLGSTGAPPVTIPFMVVKRLAPAAVLFALYNMIDDPLPLTSELAGFIVGLAGGLVLTKGVNENESPVQRVAATMAVTTIIAVASAVPLRGIADVRPEMTRVLAVEDRTAQAYQAAADQFKRGRMTAEALAQVIDQKIVPEFQTADSRLSALERVPLEHQPLVADAKEYVRLRSASWRLRAEGLRKTGAPTIRKSTRTEVESDASWRMRAESQYRTNMTTFGKAEGAERASLAVLERIKTADLK